jgi:hypothetical protein
MIIPSPRSISLGFAAMVIGATSCLAQQFNPRDAVELSGTISIEASQFTFKECGFNGHVVSLLPGDSRDKLIEQAKQDQKYNRDHEAGQDYIYARIELTYVKNAKQRNECIGQLHGVSQCAIVGPTATFYRSHTTGTCYFR